MRPLVITLLFALGSAVCLAVEAPPLDKAEARQIVEGMAWTEVSIVAVRQGVDAKGAVAPILATLIGIGKLQGQYRSICQTVYYDNDLGWHVMTLTDRTVQIW